MKHTWADPNKEWDGFQFMAYSLDASKVAALPLTQRRNVDGKVEELSTTVGDIYGNLVDQPFEVEPFAILAIKIKTSKEKLTFSGPAFNLNILAELLSLRKDGADPFTAQWFWYDRDSCRDDPQDLYSFFVVCNDKIVRERVSFSDYHGNGFDPSLFDPGSDIGSIWFSDTGWREASVRFWYRKFYTETRMGQLMILRDDEPELYDYQSRPGADMRVLLSQNIVTVLKRIHILLWVLIALAVANLMRLWK